MRVLCAGRMLQSLRGQQTDARGRRTATCPPPRPGPATSNDPLPFYGREQGDATMLTKPNPVHQDTMEAIVQDEYGSPDVLELRDVDKPGVKDDEVLVRVHAASVHPDVWHVVRGRPYALRLMGAGLLKPKNSVPGTDAAGHVESVGKNVTQFRPGDEVFGETSRQWQWHNGGAYAEYVAVPEDQLALKPANISLEQAAAVPSSGFIALS